MRTENLIGVSRRLTLQLYLCFIKTKVKKCYLIPPSKNPHSSDFMIQVKSFFLS